MKLRGLRMDAICTRHSRLKFFLSLTSEKLENYLYRLFLTGCIVAPMRPTTGCFTASEAVGDSFPASLCA